MTEISLLALEGTNPLGFLAALGALGALDRAGRDPTLRWTDELVPVAMLAGASDEDDLISVLDEDRERWKDGSALWWPPDGPLSDAKADGEQLRAWARAVYEAAPDHPDDSYLFCALVAEGAFDRGGTNAKPTHFHFTAGQQRFLVMARELETGLDADRLREAVFGPWRYDSPLPSLSWDARGERVYAVRATNPSKEKRLGIPGADWLALRGLVAYPVAHGAGTLETTACDRSWKRSAFRWPLWSVPLSYRVVRSLVADPDLVSEDPSRRRLDRHVLAARGILRVMEAPIRRTDQGGYGSFGGPVALAEASIDV